MIKREQNAAFNRRQITKNSYNLENFLPCAIQQAESASGLKVSWVRDDYELVLSGKKGLFAMYCEVFAEEPYREKFSAAEVADYFQEILCSGGLIFTAVKERKGEPDKLTAFVASQPLASKMNVIPLVEKYVDVSASSYFAEDAVIPENRRQGISRCMKTLLLESNNIAGYKSMVLRTSAESFRQAAAVAQLGGKPIDGLYQDVDTLRLDGQVTPDRRVFFTFDLSCYSPAGSI